MIKRFPIEHNDPQGDDNNPGIKLFGRRLFGDEQTLDLLAEFLLIFASQKKISSEKFDVVLPNIDVLKAWRAHSLVYFPKAHLNLKLFSFLSSSRLELRHATHRQHAEDLLASLRQKIDLENLDEKNDLLKALGLLFLGFWGNGANRTWCAQTFLPFCSGVLSSEIIWNASVARRAHLHSWSEVIDGFNSFFGQGKHTVFCCGGEVLFLQICNALSKTKEDIETWISSKTDESRGTLGFSEIERTPESLHTALCKDFAEFFSLTPKALNEVMEFIDTGVDAETAEKSDFDGSGEPRGVKCGWVPQESWREGYLFAVELHRILSANVGLIEKVELLETACALQLMRSLAAQSYRHSRTVGGYGDGLDYRALICDTSSRKRKMKSFSADSHSEISREIQQAIRISEIYDEVVTQCNNDLVKIERLYKQADSQYGFKLYRKIGKSIGLIVPPSGAKMRYTLTDKLLKYLVVAMMSQERMTLETFKKQIELHHGFVFDLDALAASRNWRERKAELAGQEKSSEYLEKMLEASGALVRLSDSCSLVKNPYIGTTNEGANQ